MRTGVSAGGAATDLSIGNSEQPTNGMVCWFNKEGPTLSGVC